MTTQFIHIGSVGLSASSRHPAWHSVGGILAEAARVAGARGHIVRPRAPRLLHGIEPLDVEAKVLEMAAGAVDAKGRRIRRDAVVMYALVASYPVPMKAVLGDAWSHYEAWRTATLTWLTQNFGDRLTSVVEHLDETHPHIHAFIVPGLDEDGRIDHGLHPGYAARNAARRKGVDHKGAERAYRAGMREFQDNYAETVSAAFGHARLGPRRRRLRRDAVLARRAAALVSTAMADVARGMACRQLVSNRAAQSGFDTTQLHKLSEACSSLSAQLQTGQPPDLSALAALLEEVDARADPDAATAPGSPQTDEVADDRDEDIGPADFDGADEADDEIYPDTDFEKDMDGQEDHAEYIEPDWGDAPDFADEDPS